MRKFVLLNPDQDYYLPESLCRKCSVNWSETKKLIFSNKQVAKSINWEKFLKEKLFCEHCSEIVLLFAEKGFPLKNPDWPFPFGDCLD